MSKINFFSVLNTLFIMFAGYGCGIAIKHGYTLEILKGFSLFMIGYLLGIALVTLYFWYKDRR